MIPIVMHCDLRGTCSCLVKSLGGESSDSAAAANRSLGWVSSSVTVLNFASLLCPFLRTVAGIVRHPCDHVLDRRGRKLSGMAEVDINRKSMLIMKA